MSLANRSAVSTSYVCKDSVSSLSLNIRRASVHLILCCKNLRAVIKCFAAGGGGNEGGEEEVWRGHSIAALRRRASELSAAIPPYLQLNYDAHSPVY